MTNSSPSNNTKGFVLNVLTKQVPSDTRSMLPRYNAQDIAIVDIMLAQCDAETQALWCALSGVLCQLWHSLTKQFCEYTQGRSLFVTHEERIINLMGATVTTTSYRSVVPSSLPSCKCRGACRTGVHIRRRTWFADMQPPVHILRHHQITG